jgi:hypothetical protein
VNLAVSAGFTVVSPPTTKPSYVAVVADNQQTLDNLGSYLTSVGIASNGARELGEASAIPPGAASLVLFPDDFDRKAVEAFIIGVRRSRPRLLILLVSSAPQHLSAAVEPDGSSVPPLVLPRPAFGWTILDAIRARAPDLEAD